MRIWKYEVKETWLRGRIFSLESDAAIEMPQDARFLDAQTDPGDEAVVSMWFEVDPSAPMETRYFAVVGTGRDYEFGKGFASKYLATIKQTPFMWHLFEIWPEAE